MVQNVNPTFVKTPNASVATISTGAGITLGLITAYTGGVNGSKINGISVTSNTTLTQDVRLWVFNGGSGAFFNAVSVTGTAGLTSTQPPINGFGNSAAAVDSDGNPYLFLPSTAWTLQFQVTSNSSQWATGSTLNLVVTSAGDF